VFIFFFRSRSVHSHRVLLVHSIPRLFPLLHYDLIFLGVTSFTLRCLFCYDFLIPVYVRYVYHSPISTFFSDLHPRFPHVLLLHLHSCFGHSLIWLCWCFDSRLLLLLFIFCIHFERSYKFPHSVICDIDFVRFVARLPTFALFFVLFVTFFFFGAFSWFRSVRFFEFSFLVPPTFFHSFVGLVTVLRSFLGRFALFFGYDRCYVVWFFLRFFVFWRYSVVCWFRFYVVTTLLGVVRSPVLLLRCWFVVDLIVCWCVWSSLRYKFLRCSLRADLFVCLFVVHWFCCSLLSILRVTLNLHIHFFFDVVLLVHFRVDSTMDIRFPFALISTTFWSTVRLFPFSRFPLHLQFTLRCLVISSFCFDPTVDPTGIPFVWISRYVRYLRFSFVCSSLLLISRSHLLFCTLSIIRLRSLTLPAIFFVTLFWWFWFCSDSVCDSSFFFCILHSFCVICLFDYDFVVVVDFVHSLFVVCCFVTFRCITFLFVCLIIRLRWLRSRSLPFRFFFFTRSFCSTTLPFWFLPYLRLFCCLLRLRLRPVRFPTSIWFPFTFRCFFFFYLWTTYGPTVFYRSRCCVVRLRFFVPFVLVLPSFFDFFGRYLRPLILHVLRSFLLFCRCLFRSTNHFVVHLTVTFLPDSHFAVEFPLFLILIFLHCSSLIHRYVLRCRFVCFLDSSFPVRPVCLRLVSLHSKFYSYNFVILFVDLSFHFDFLFFFLFILILILFVHSY